ncbi:MAG: hypothetical protein EXR38_06970 [Methylotenera sp.]|nr:hypothetical protein [Methylotenera sp.]MSQ00211.1 hypothetical protein [Methylotenera sp.]
MAQTTTLSTLVRQTLQLLALLGIVAACWPSISLAEEEYTFPLGPDHTPTTLHMSQAMANPPAYAPQTYIKPSPTAIRMTYESFSLPGGENMGMLGADLLVSVNDHLRLGIGTYGALRGERGGFITLGVEGELQQRINESWMSHAGLFVGAGGGHGGDYTLSGGGLMLRGDVGVSYESKGYGNIGFGVSHVRFPSGVIASTQPYVQYEYPFNSLLGAGWPDIPAPNKNIRLDPVQASSNEFSLVARNYSIAASAVKDDGQPQTSSMQLVGVEWLSYLNERWFLKVESEGAMGGENNGYMQILLGGGYRLPITRSTSLKLHAAAGPAGGGGADTGGGLLLDAGLGLQQNISKNTAIELSIGGITAPSHSFEALNLALKLNYQFGLPDVSSSAVSWNALGDFDTEQLRIRLANQTYFKADPNWRNRSINQAVSNLGVQVDYFMSPNWFITGQGLAAYAGDAGAYMTGEVGLGTQWAFSKNWFVEGEALVGAAGGGGLAVGGGLVAQGNASLGYRLSDSLTIMATAGHIEALRGDFKANVAGASLAYQLMGFTAK